MTTIPCPHGDNGICTIPDRTAVVVDGRVEVATRREIQRRFPNLDLTTTELRRIEFAGEAELASAMAGGGGGEASDVDRDDTLRAVFDEIESTGRLPNEGVRRAILDAASNSPSGTGIVVRCSCKHDFVADG